MKKLIALTILLATTCFGQTKYEGIDPVNRTLVNQVLYSEEFDNGYWVKSNATVTANATIAPDGTMTADKLVETATTAIHYLYNTAFSTSDKLYTASAYLKSAGRDHARIQFFLDGIQSKAWINLTNCQVGYIIGTPVVTSYSVGDGWCRLSLTKQAIGDYASSFIYLAPSILDGNDNYSGDITKGIYIWGAQINYASQPPDYVKTTSAAVTLGPLCPAGTSQSLIDPNRCFALRRKGMDYTLGK